MRDACWMRVCASAGLLAIALVACKPRGSGDALPAPDGAAPTTQAEADAQAQYDLIAQMAGVWATVDKSAGGGAETVFMLGHEVDTHMSMTRNGAALDVLTEDVHPAEGTATFRFRESPTHESLTFRLIASPEGVESGGYGLRVTYADGRHETLAFVRRLSAHDMEQMDSAAEAQMLSTATGQPGPAPVVLLPGMVDCNAAVEFRAHSVCKDEALRGLDRQLATRFARLKDKGADVEGTQRAAYRQLDACNSGECLQRAYADWSKYLDDNFANNN